MNREAVALGTPVYSTFAGRLGGVDEQLLRAGLPAGILTSEDELELVKQERARARSPAATPAVLTDIVLAPSESAMPTVVVKLGSSVVAEASATCARRARARLRRVAALHAEGVDVVDRHLGRDRRGMRLLELPIRPRAIEDLQAASAVGQGKLYRVYDELLRDRGLTSAQVLLTFFDISARTHYVNARRTLRKLLDWRIVPVVNENDTTTTDAGHLRRQRLPRRPGGGADRRRAARAAHRHRRPLHRRPARRPGGDARRPGRGPRGARRARDRGRDLAARLGRDALEGRRGRDGHRGRDRDRDRLGPRGRRDRAARGRASRRARASRPRPARHSSFKLWLKYAKPSHGTLRVDAGAARALREGGTSLLPVGIVEVHGSFDAGDAVEVREAGDGPIGKGICNYSAVELRRVMGRKSAAGARGAAARDRGSSPPGLLRARLDLFRPWPSQSPFRHRHLPRRPRRLARLARMSAAAKDAALLRVADALEERAPRSSRPTRATSRRGASPASPTR